MAPLFLHCVDSRLEENATWYGRLHLGPFPRHVALTLATALRRALLQDLPSPQIRAIELPNAPHEYSRLQGVHEPVLDLLLQFRKVALTRPYLLENPVVSEQHGPWLATFSVRGPGVFHAKDLHLPAGFRCINSELVLAHLAPGALLEGRVFITLQDGARSSRLPGSPYPTGSVGNWLAVGRSGGPVQRVRFRIEDVGPLRADIAVPILGLGVGAPAGASNLLGTELVIFEIATNGSLSPIQALRQAAERLVRLFAGLLRLSIGGLPSRGFQPLSTKRSGETTGSRRDTNLISRDSIPNAGMVGFPSTVPLLQQSLQGYRRFGDPLGLDLGNLDLTLESYQYWRQQGIQTVGELVQRLQNPSLLVSNSTSTLQSQHRLDQRKQSLVQLGLRLAPVGGGSPSFYLFSLWN